MEFITRPLGWLLLQLYNIVGNYGGAIILFAVVVKLVMMPFQMKSKRSQMRMNRLSPRVKELEKKCGDNKQQYQEEVNKLYKSQGIKPMSGCLWSLIPFPIVIAFYTVIRQPLHLMMGIATEKITEITDFLVSSGFYTIPEKSGAYEQLNIVSLIHDKWAAVIAEFPDIGLVDINFNFLGLNLGQQPSYKVWTFDFSSPELWMPAVGLLLIPVISCALQFLSMKMQNAMNPQMQEQQGSMKGMTLIMPLFSLYFCFMFPAAVGVYWIAQSVTQIIQDFFLNKHYKKILDAEDADRFGQERAREEELERKRLETERLRAEGKLPQNKNTSKKKLQAQDRVKEEERLAAERAAEREALGLTKELPDSQVGTRRYARGRAFVEERFENPVPVEDASEAEDEFELLEAAPTAAKAPTAAPESDADSDDFDDEEYDDEDED